jgi:hypothetical protein
MFFLSIAKCSLMMMHRNNSVKQRLAAAET